MSKRSWKWFGDLDEAEKAVAMEILSRHERLRGEKLAFDGESLLAYDRPPTQAYYFKDDDGEWMPGMRECIDSGEVIDTHDGGFLMLRPVAK